MHGQNINLPVCVCVCVSVTLSVNPPTDQTPQQIFTVDGFMQGCAFWGSRWSHLAIHSPPKPPFWRPEYAFQTKYAKNSNSYIFRSVYQINMTFDSQLCRTAAQSNRLRGWSRMMVKQFQDGGRPPYWKSIYRHISAKNHPISMKFCTQQQILNWMNVTW